VTATAPSPNEGSTAAPSTACLFPLTRTAWGSGTIPTVARTSSPLRASFSFLETALAFSLSLSPSSDERLG
jgi:hypothetical protein